MFTVVVSCQFGFFKGKFVIFVFFYSGCVTVKFSAATSNDLT